MASLVQGNNKINNSLVSKIRAIDPYLKKEQEQAVEKLLLGEDVLAILPTGFRKSRIFQAYSCVKDNEMNGCSVVLVIAPLSSIIDDQITALKSSGNPAVLFSSAENV
jgi:ATP-dependent DNA helicase RecQ